MRLRHAEASFGSGGAVASAPPQPRGTTVAVNPSGEKRVMRLNEMMGKPVIAADTGEKVGRVDDLLLDRRHHHVVGVLVTDGVLAKQRVLPFGDVQTVGTDAIVVRTAIAICDASDWIRRGRPANRSRSIHGKDVVTAEGARVGRVHDVVADERTGDVVALEVTTGRQGARLARPALVHAASSLRLTNEVVVNPQKIAGTREP
jgi:uncharacterized protein YrrD